MDHELSQLSFEDAIQLPLHLRCASHILNLIASRDVPSSLANKDCRKLMRSSLAKCSALWNRVQRSVKAAEVVEAHANRALVIPNNTRWNSLYKALVCIRDIPSVSCDRIADELKKPRFTVAERRFLSEYCKIFGPLAEALDILQGENNASLSINQIFI